ncbi:MAG TPA: hypothetical protein VMG98_12465 [Verrucomicrobiae bacterium]|nr:hypothetical protein [Verrucomicrobiae bacterium]
MFATSLALALALANAPGTQYAYTGTAPVTVASCALEPAPPALSLPYSPPSAAGEASTAISFENEAPATVASVTFDVSDGRTTSRIVDRGAFSSGVAIDHSFFTPQFQDDLGNVTCSVQAVAFTDGSTWQAQ